MKTYIEPTIEVINIETRQMLATSTQLDIDGKYNGTTPVESRGSNWDDEEDEEW